MDETTAGTAVGVGFMGVFCLFYLVIMAVSVAGLVLWVIMLVDVCRREFTDPNAKLIWLLVIIFGSFVGAIVYHYVGKPQGRLPR